jgi:putative redox protein
MAHGSATAASTMIKVEQQPGKQLRLTARGHTVIADRPVADGGSDTGCTSGELLLMAIGSCCAGSVRNYLEQRGTSCADLRVDVAFEPTGPQMRDRIAVTLHLPIGCRAADRGALTAAATAGGVTSRLKLGSTVVVRFAEHHKEA